MTTLTRFTKNLSEISLSRTEITQYGLITLWILAMISLPILKWTFGREIIPNAVTGALLIQFAAVFFILHAAWGWQRVVVAFIVVAITTWGMEFLGSSTGFPFGEYDYTDTLQPQLGHVPLLIPLAWFMMLPSAWAIAEVIVGRKKLWAYAAVSGIAITAWDLFLDPQMVDWDFWQWDNPVGYFGIPWVNYAGWFLTGIVVTALVRPYRFQMPIRPLLTIYGVVWFLQSFGQAIFWGQPGPALVGSLAMGSLLLIAIYQYRSNIINGESTPK